MMREDVNAVLMTTVLHDIFNEAEEKVAMHEGTVGSFQADSTLHASNE